MPFEETIVASATPRGESALALVRLSGPECGPLAESIFGRSPTPRKASLGTYRSCLGGTVDEVVFTYYANNASFTGEPMLEISCHGNPLIVQMIVEDLLRRGCRMAEPGEFTKTAFLNGRMDLSQAEAVIDVIHARSVKALEASQRQLRGSVGKRVEKLADALLQIIAQLEAYIDFPEEDLPDEDTAGPLLDLKHLAERMDRLIATRHYSELLHEGVKAVIIGEPNAGKSSLLNALTGEERVLVSAEPGTTRDFVEDRIMIGPYSLRVIDTAGLHEAASEIERRGIGKTLEQLESADLCLVVLDSTSKVPDFPATVVDRLRQTPTVVVENKADLEASAEMSEILAGFPHCRVSALRGDGLAALRDAVLRVLEEDVTPPGEDQVLVSARHAHALESAKAAVLEALEKLRSDAPTELVASDLRGALDALGEITGKIDNERMLDKLFATFCIGK